MWNTKYVHVLLPTSSQSEAVQDIKTRWNGGVVAKAKVKVDSGGDGGGEGETAGVMAVVKVER